MKYLDISVDHYQIGILLVAQITIRKYSKKDENQVRDICYRTGYMGKDLSQLNKFNDKKLFNLLFCDYYIQYQPESCFVAEYSNENLGNQTVGYIIGSRNTTKQILEFKLTILPKIITKLFGFTLWKYPYSFFDTIKFFLYSFKVDYEEIYTNYPAHFHINIHPHFQGEGIGSKLLNTFENYLKENSIEGVHLSTTSQNRAAIDFYKKYDYELLRVFSDNLWQVDNVLQVVMGKKL